MENKKIKVIIEETISQEFEIEANDVEEAMKIAEQLYYDGDIVVDAGTLTGRLMSACEDEVWTDWVQF